jgi:hypothetical protein
MFHNEMGVLDWRMHELDDVVDRFVLVEATVTHCGNPRTVVYPCGHAQFSEFVGKMQCVVVEDLPRGDDPWKRERAQRRAIWTRGFAETEMLDDDVVIVSDLDEVPPPELVREIAARRFEVPLRVRPHWYNFNWHNYLGPWAHSSIIFYTVRMLKLLYASGRGDEVGIAGVPAYELEGVHGWHASWFGSDKTLRDKLVAYAHAPEEHNRRIADKGINEIRRRRNQQGDFFGNVVGPVRLQPPALPRFAHLALRNSGDSLLNSTP